MRPKRVEDQDPIKQLQSLLTDRNKVLERIFGIHAMLDSMKSPASSAASIESSPNTASVAPAPSAEPYDRLSHMLRDMQSQIENQVRPLAQQAIDFEVQRLRERAAIDQRDLRGCLEQIDRCVSACIQRAREYQREWTLDRPGSDAGAAAGMRFGYHRNYQLAITVAARPAEDLSSAC